MESINIVSYGAGVDSTALILRMLDQEIKIDHVVFADTGGELPETYQTVEYMEAYLFDRNIPFTTVRNFKLVTLFERCIARRVFPDMFRRWCTRDFKVAPIHRFYKKFYKGYHIEEYLGIDSGETRRCRTAKEDYITKHYPLIKWGMDRLACMRFILKKKFPIVIKSGCHFCPFNSSERWDYIQNNHPDLYKMDQQLEQQSKHYPKMKLINKTKKTDDYCGNGFS